MAEAHPEPQPPPAATRRKRKSDEALESAANRTPLRWRLAPTAIACQGLGVLCFPGSPEAQTGATSLHSCFSAGISTVLVFVLEAARNLLGQGKLRANIVIEAVPHVSLRTYVFYRVWVFCNDPGALMECALELAAAHQKDLRQILLSALPGQPGAGPNPAEWWAGLLLPGAVTVGKNAHADPQCFAVERYTQPNIPDAIAAIEHFFLMDPVVTTSAQPLMVQPPMMGEATSWDVPDAIAANFTIAPLARRALALLNMRLVCLFLDGQHAAATHLNTDPSARSPQPLDVYMAQYYAEYITPILNELRAIRGANGPAARIAMDAIAVAASETYGTLFFFGGAYSAPIALHLGQILLHRHISTVHTTVTMPVYDDMSLLGCWRMALDLLLAHNECIGIPAIPEVAMLHLNLAFLGNVTAKMNAHIILQGRGGGGKSNTKRKIADLMTAGVSGPIGQDATHVTPLALTASAAQCKIFFGEEGGHASKRTPLSKTAVTERKVGVSALDLVPTEHGTVRVARDSIAVVRVTCLDTTNESQNLPPDERAAVQRRRLLLVQPEYSQGAIAAMTMRRGAEVGTAVEQMIKSMDTLSAGLNLIRVFMTSLQDVGIMPPPDFVLLDKLAGDLSSKFGNTPDCPRLDGTSLNRIHSIAAMQANLQAHLTRFFDPAAPNPRPWSFSDAIACPLPIIDYTVATDSIAHSQSPLELAWGALLIEEIWKVNRLENRAAFPPSASGTRMHTAACAVLDARAVLIRAGSGPVHSSVDGLYQAMVTLLLEAYAADTLSSERSVNASTDAEILFRAYEVGGCRYSSEAMPPPPRGVAYTRMGDDAPAIDWQEALRADPSFRTGSLVVSRSAWIAIVNAGLSRADDTHNTRAWQQAIEDVRQATHMRLDAPLSDMLMRIVDFADPDGVVVRRSLLVRPPVQTPCVPSVALLLAECPVKDILRLSEAFVISMESLRTSLAGAIRPDRRMVIVSRERTLSKMGTTLMTSLATTAAYTAMQNPPSSLYVQEFLSSLQNTDVCADRELGVDPVTGAKVLLPAQPINVRALNYVASENAWVMPVGFFEQQIKQGRNPRATFLQSAYTTASDTRSVISGHNADGMPLYEKTTPNPAGTQFPIGQNISVPESLASMFKGNYNPAVKTVFTDDPLKILVVRALIARYGSGFEADYNDDDENAVRLVAEHISRLDATVYHRRAHLSVGSFDGAWRAAAAARRTEMAHGAAPPPPPQSLRESPRGGSSSQPRSEFGSIPAAQWARGVVDNVPELIPLGSAHPAPSGSLHSPSSYHHTSVPALRSVAAARTVAPPMVAPPTAGERRPPPRQHHAPLPPARSDSDSMRIQPIRPLPRVLPPADPAPRQFHTAPRSASNFGGIDQPHAASRLRERSESSSNADTGSNAGSSSRAGGSSRAGTSVSAALPPFAKRHRSE